MRFLQEFKTFALKGNVMDMAVGVIIGSAFSKIVSSLVNDIIMPPIGVLVGKTNFSKLKLDISWMRDILPGEAPAEPVYWNYGAFIQQCVDFGILAFCVFLMVKLMNKLTRKREKNAEPVTEPVASSAPTSLVSTPEPTPGQRAVAPTPTPAPATVASTTPISVSGQTTAVATAPVAAHVITPGQPAATATTPVATPSPAPTQEEILLLTEIRDLLKRQAGDKEESQEMRDKLQIDNRR